MQDFYSSPDISIALNKVERRRIWDNFIKNRDLSQIAHIENQVPALYCEMEKALRQGRNIQSAVFSECVYAQGLADKFNLDIFVNLSRNPKLVINNQDDSFHGLKSFAVRYSYSKNDNVKTLHQAGGAGGVDCALILKGLKKPIMIEMKEPYAKVSELDLPKYGEDGFIISNQDFELKYPQFKSMLNEQIEKKLNFFQKMGTNIVDFSPASIEQAVTKNYTGSKFADVICTEDENGMLTIIPSNHVAKWARLEGEIRPSGRNPYPVWTPKKLLQMLNEMGANVDGEMVKVAFNKFKEANARGSRNISRYKLNPLFFVRESSIERRGSYAFFPINVIRQLNPTITAKMNFKGLNVAEVRKFYERFY